MKHLFTLLFAFATLSLTAQIKTPAPSPMCKITQTVGLTEVSLEFSRPSIKGRNIFGDLVPFGTMWRTGANASSKISFSDDVSIEGNAIKAGQYAIYTIPGENDWEVILYSDVSHWGTPDEWKADQEAARFKVKSYSMPVTVESMTFMIDNLENDKAQLSLIWDKTIVPMTLTVPTDELVMKTINRTMNGPVAGDYYSAGRYYFESGKDKGKALEYVQKANSMDPKFWTLRMESLILADMGKKKDAIAAAKKSLAMATEAKNEDYVRMNEKSIAEWSGK
ncbi:MAG: DUF2911 domain-containing protein [Saprospiraceae bacterium]|nr:DUF2911 domain-containing protein [Saprospiraceae bacterium]